MDNNKSQFVKIGDNTFLNKDNVVEVNFKKINETTCKLLIKTNISSNPMSFIKENYYGLKGPCNAMIDLRDKFIKN
jgi:hypothetical protein